MVPRAYVELAPDRALAGVLVCTWQRTPGPGGEIVVVPDGCVDLVWRSDGELFIAGPDRGPVRYRQAPGIEFVGVRLRPGTAATVLGCRVDELCDRRVELGSLWGSGGACLADRLADATSTGARRQILATAVHERVADARLDAHVLAAVHALATGTVNVTELPERVGLGARQLRRRFVQQVGYGRRPLTG